MATPKPEDESPTITINRAPVLALWAAVVAERLGYDRSEAATLGRAVSGLNAQTKGRRLGLFKPGSRDAEARAGRAPHAGAAQHVALLGREVPVVRTEAGLRATKDGKPEDPAAALRYLEGKFGEGLGPARAAMEELARAFEPADLAERGFALYEAFRPAIPAGQRGWGVKGVLDLARIRALAGRRPPR